MSRASDPLNIIKRHFEELIDNINSKKEKEKRQLAIFIDDIDRCNKEFIVELLEGIQTLFKEKRVLYIVAGDKNWITTSFGNTYSEFKKDDQDSDRLGDQFLEKAFQLSFRLPNVSDDAKMDYWNYILGLDEKDDGRTGKNKSFDKLKKVEKDEIKRAFKDPKTDIANPEFMKQMEQTYKLSADSVSDIIIEEKNKDSKELQHLLKNFHSIIDPNPRSIIRLANNYTMIRSTLIAERKHVSADKIFRWLVIEDLFPRIKSEIDSFSSIDKITKFFEINIQDKTTKDICNKLLHGKHDEESTALVIDEIKNIMGL